MTRLILISMVEPAPPLLIEEMRNIFNHKSQRNKQLGHSFPPAIRSYLNICSKFSPAHSIFCSAIALYLFDTICQHSSPAIFASHYNVVTPPPPPPTPPPAPIHHQ